MRKTVALSLIAVLSGMAFGATPSYANPNCSSPEALVAGRIALANAPAGGESHWYTLSTSSPVRVQIWNTGAQTGMQVFTSNCSTLVCNTAQLGGTCLVNGGSWRITVWSNGGSDYAVTVTPAV